MRRLILSAILCFGAVTVAVAQNAHQSAAEAAKALAQAPEAEQKVEKPKYWSESLKTNVKFGQTGLTNWAAGGDNTVTLQAYIDGNANYKKGNLFWNNRLQLDFGFMYASSKPIVQKSDDRIYLESKFGYKSDKMKDLYFSANFDFKSQFANGYDYLTPSIPEGYEEGTKLNDLPLKDQIRLWNGARKLKSGFLAPAYTNLALGIDWKPFNWLSFNIAPLTGGFVIVTDEQLRKNYGMTIKDQAGYDAAVAAGSTLLGQYYSSSRFEFGAQIKTDIAVKINNNFSYTTQIVLFSNYLDHPENIRVNWDNRFDWNLAKYFSLTLTTNLIYDDKVQIFSPKDNLTIARVQFKEAILFGFTYTITH